MKAKEIERALLKKGFSSHDTDHKYFVLYVDGKKTSVRTKISHGERDIHSPLIEQMQKQLRLSSKDFTDLVRCPLTKEMYIEKLRRIGAVR